MFTERLSPTPDLCVNQRDLYLVTVSGKAYKNAENSNVNVNLITSSGKIKMLWLMITKSLINQ